MEDYTADILKGTSIGLFGCVLFWNILKNKPIRKFLLKKFSPEALNKIAWTSSIFAKGVGAAYYIRAGKRYYIKKRDE